MKTINNNTQRGRAFINAYYNSRAYSLSDCYGRYSFEKGRAEALCKRAMINEGGYDYRILSFNTFGFTCGWMTPAGLRVETACNSYFIPAEA